MEENIVGRWAVKLYLYLLDLFKPLDLSWSELVQLEDPLKAFEAIRCEVECVLGTIESVKHYATYISPRALGARPSSSTSSCSRARSRGHRCGQAHPH